jgi:hypothetical protein
LLVDASGGIANVVLTIQVAGKHAVPEETPATLEQRRCRFEPHVLLVAVGRPVEFLTTDECALMVHTLPKRNPATNQLVEKDARQADRRYEIPETFEVKNDLRPWMSAWVVVTDAPFSALTGEDGSFEIQDLPHGPLQLTLWHEKLGQQSQRVDIASGKTTEVQLTLSAPGDQAPPR